LPVAILTSNVRVEDEENAIEPSYRISLQALTWYACIPVKLD
jgi:hypothetical protein